MTTSQSRSRSTRWLPGSIALLRRAGITQGSRDHILTVADLVLDDDSRAGAPDGELIDLTKTESSFYGF